MHDLKEFRFVFEYNDKDLKKGKIKANTFKKKPGLFIDLIAFDDNEEYELCIFLTMKKEELEKLSNEIVTINNKVGYIDFYKPNSNQIPTIDLTPANVMYANPGNIWALQEEDNYFFKISIPDEKLFVWFHLDKKLISEENEE